MDLYCERGHAEDGEYLDFCVCVCVCVWNEMISSLGVLGLGLCGLCLFCVCVCVCVCKD